MLINSKGFTLAEVLIASSILFTMIVIIVPIGSLLAGERHLLSERFEYTAQLHEELQLFLREEDKQLPESYTQTLDGNSISFLFTKEPNNFIKGCVTWTNVRNTVEETCLYGYRKK